MGSSQSPLEMNESVCSSCNGRKQQLENLVEKLRNRIEALEAENKKYSRELSRIKRQNSYRMDQHPTPEPDRIPTAVLIEPNPLTDQMDVGYAARVESSIVEREYQPVQESCLAFESVGPEDRVEVSAEEGRAPMSQAVKKEMKIEEDSEEGDGQLKPSYTVAKVEPKSVAIGPMKTEVDPESASEYHEPLISSPYEIEPMSVAVDSTKTEADPEPASEYHEPLISIPNEVESMSVAIAHIKTEVDIESASEEHHEPLNYIPNEASVIDSYNFPKAVSKILRKKKMRNVEPMSVALAHIKTEYDTDSASEEHHEPLNYIPNEASAVDNYKFPKAMSKNQSKKKMRNQRYRQSKTFLKKIVKTSAKGQRGVLLDWEAIDALRNPQNGEVVECFIMAKQDQNKDGNYSNGIEEIAEKNKIPLIVLKTRHEVHQISGTTGLPKSRFVAIMKVSNRNKFNDCVKGFGIKL